MCKKHSVIIIVAYACKYERTGRGVSFFFNLVVNVGRAKFIYVERIYVKVNYL